MSETTPEAVEAPTMIVTDEGVRVRLEDAKRFGIDTTTLVAGGTAELRRTTTAAAVPAVVKSDAEGTVLTSAADPSGADDGQVPAGTNLGLAAPPTEATTEQVAAATTTDTTEGTTDGAAAADQPAGAGDADKPAGRGSKAGARR